MFLFYLFFFLFLFWWGCGLFQSRIEALKLFTQINALYAIQRHLYKVH